jgi:hypothetical protein
VISRQITRLSHLRTRLDSRSKCRMRRSSLLLLTRFLRCRMVATSICCALQVVGLAVLRRDRRVHFANQCVGTIWDFIFVRCCICKAWEVFVLVFRFVLELCNGNALSTPVSKHTPDLQRLCSVLTGVRSSRAATRDRCSDCLDACHATLR